MFGRLVLVTDRASATLNTVAEYRYSGLGFQIGWHYEADSDSDGEPPKGVRRAPKILVQQVI